MILVLEIVGEHAGKFGLDSRKVFKARGGTIGRLPQSDWCLPDPHVSGRHAEIAYADDRFLLIDTSTNGVWINAEEERLPPGEPRELANGDRIFIDAYELGVTLLDADGLGSSPIPAIPAVEQDAAAVDYEAPPTASSPRFAAPWVSGETDPLRLIGRERAQSPLSPQPEQGPLQIPSDYDPLRD